MLEEAVEVTVTVNHLATGIQFAQTEDLTLHLRKSEATAIFGRILLILRKPEKSLPLLPYITNGEINLQSKRSKKTGRLLTCDVARSCFPAVQLSYSPIRLPRALPRRVHAETRLIHGQRNHTRRYLD
jgi:hypothetical protein